MNASKSGLNAGIKARNTVNKATNAVVDTTQTVTSAVAGFFKGFIQGDTPVVVHKLSSPKKPAPAKRAYTRKTKATTN